MDKPNKGKDCVPITHFYKAIDKKQQQTITQEAAQAFGKFLSALKIDWKVDPQTKDTPLRVAKMYVKEFLSARFSTAPIMKFFKSKATKSILVSGPTAFRSLCPHHCIPFIGFITIGLIPHTKNGHQHLLGLSKYARLIQWYTSRAHMQEQLGSVLLAALEKNTKSKKIAVFICASHICCTHRGVMKTQKKTLTLHMTKKFEQDPLLRKEFLAITQTHIQQFKN